MVMERVRANSGFGESAARPAEWIGEYPASSMLMAFAVGVGVGIVAGQALADAIIGEDRRMSTRLRRAWEGALPEAIARHLGSCGR